MKQRLEHEIVGLFACDVTAVYSIHQISTTLGKAYPHINKTVVSLVESGVLTRTIVGRSHLCSINLQNPLTRNLLARYAIDRLQSSTKFYPKFTKELQPLKTSMLFAVCIEKNIHLMLTNLEDQALYAQTLYGLPIRFHTSESWNRYLLSSYPKNKNPLILCGFENYYTLIAQMHRELMQQFSIFKAP